MLSGLRIVFVFASISLTACDEASGDFDMEMLSLSRTSLVIKSHESAALNDCRVLINGASGFWYEPGGVNFKKGQSRNFILSRFFTSTKRQFNYNVDSISRISVNCSNPRGVAIVFETNDPFGGFLQ